MPKIFPRSFVAALILCSLFSSLSAAAAEAPNEGSSMTLLYWDNKNLGFGHVALRVSRGSPGGESYYFSYAMGNDYQTDLAKHEKAPRMVGLPHRSSGKFDVFEDWFLASPYVYKGNDSYGDDYSLLRHNCAHAVLYALRTHGYNIPIKGESPFALMPRSIYRAALAYSSDQD